APGSARALACSSTSPLRPQGLLWAFRLGPRLGRAPGATGAAGAPDAGGARTGVPRAALRSEGPAPVLWPALHHHLRLRVELDAVGALRVQVAEEALGPAAEGEERHGRRHPQVDADVAGDGAVT